MKLKVLSSIIIVTVLASCSSIISVVENTNTKKKFETKKDYVDFINKKAVIPSEKIVVLNDNIYNSLESDLALKHLFTYYGIINKDNFAGAEQMEDMSCPGQIKTLYKKFSGDPVGVVMSKIPDSLLFNQLALDNSKNTLLFLYSYKLGGLSKSKIFNVIKELSNRPDFDYRIIALDNYDIINK